MSRSRARSFRPDTRTAGIAAAVALLLLGWVAVRHGFYANDLIGDTAVYQARVEPVRHGAVPYRDFAFEYPPGALAVLVPPVYAGDYQTVFAWLMAVFAVCTLLLVAWERPRAAIYVAVSPLLVGALVLNRFDFWPTALAAAAVVALARDRHRLGWAALGAAFAAKLWPGSLVPLAVVWTLRRRGRSELARGVVTGAAVVAAAFVPFLVLAPHGLWESIWTQLSRPLQVESLGAALMIATNHAGIALGHGSYDVTGVLAGPFSAALAVAQGVTLLALWIAFARGPAERDRFLRYAAAAVTAFVAFGKVLSPQYLIWLVPLVPLVRGRRGLWACVVLAVAMVLTQLWYPERFDAYVYRHHLAWVVVLRDLLLVGLVAALAAPAYRFAPVRAVTETP